MWENMRSRTGVLQATRGLQVMSTHRGVVATVTAGLAMAALVACGTDQLQAGTPASPPQGEAAAEQPQPPTSREALPVELEEHPGVPWALPVDLPPGFRLLGSGPFQSDAAGVTQRQLEFVSDDGNRVVSVCVERPPARACQSQAPGGVVTRQVDGLAVTIVLMAATAPESDRAAWSRIPLTTELSRTSW